MVNYALSLKLDALFSYNARTSPFFYLIDITVMHNCRKNPEHVMRLPIRGSSLKIFPLGQRVYLAKHTWEFISYYWSETNTSDAPPSSAFEFWQNISIEHKSVKTSLKSWSPCITEHNMNLQGCCCTTCLKPPSELTDTKWAQHCSKQRFSHLG